MPTTRAELAAFWAMQTKSPADREAEEKWATEQSESSRSFRSPVEWPVYSNYTAEADPDGLEVVRAVWEQKPPEYLPMAYSQLPFELAKVNFGDREGALRFVREWGLLGYDRLIDHSEKKARIGDPFEFIWWHARTIDRLLTLHDALSKDDPDILEATLDRIAPQHETSQTNRLGEPIIGRTFTGIQGASLEQQQGYAGNYESEKLHSLQIITGFTGSNIAGIYGAVHIHGMLFPDVPPLENLAMGFFFESLIEGVWWHLARHLTGQVRLAICDGCGNYFERRDKRQRFCPPPADRIRAYERGDILKAESRCAISARVSKHRNKPTSRDTE
jgi:hypothetical protein